MEDEVVTPAFLSITGQRSKWEKASTVLYVIALVVFIVYNIILIRKSLKNA